ncbi:tRNA threonylcarbamoyladenosine dehydratase TcdA [Thermoanaerobacter kivui]|uniref:tRNA threonylcarbamoyladenosine dehydratase TcdA n=1 Tax=Thermoanaerobacter kivui TaxID=2325 RepID=A0A097AR84_THEKI|nr:tRNA threonylcarbamoyladenosine dehydratase [Thermoanaerobacter kivui]AIS52324.1 tRNA threonylcarbamoyladenosine dehydratase TcdA [Thermoanaerobacter kivui]
MHSFSRTQLLIGKEGLLKLKNSTVAVFGIGGVGSFAVEALVRAGVGKLVLIDGDNVCVTNINRQIHATTHTIGKPKVDVMKERILEINPEAQVLTFKEFYPGENSDKLLSKEYDYVIDAIDRVSSKVDLIVKCNLLSIPIISSMGAGNKLDPTKFEVADIYQTSVCPLAKVMRRELKKRGIKSLKVVYSKEEPIKNFYESEENEISSKPVPGSISFVPSVAGLILAAEVVKDLLKK